MNSEQNFTKKLLKLRTFARTLIFETHHRFASNARGRGNQYQTYPWCTTL